MALPNARRLLRYKLYRYITRVIAFLACTSIYKLSCLQLQFPRGLAFTVLSESQ
jgi:hypothetical protein